MPIYEVVTTRTIYVDAPFALDAAVFAGQNKDVKGEEFTMPNEVQEAPEGIEVYTFDLDD